MQSDQRCGATRRVKGEHMPAESEVKKDTLLFSYVIASADMRYIERSERDIYLRYEADGPLVRGEMPDCGPLCHASLGQVLLEYVMSCEGCGDGEIEAEMAEAFGERLGKALAKRLDADPDAAPAARLDAAVQCVLRSLEIPFTINEADGEVRYALDGDAIAAAAESAGIRRGQPHARLALMALLRTLAGSLAPGWAVGGEADAPDAPTNTIIAREAAGD
jgi:hypothetical protein